MKLNKFDFMVFAIACLFVYKGSIDSAICVLAGWLLGNAIGREHIK